MVTAITMNYVQEAIGIARAAEAAKMPVAISFTLETDGKLPTGQSLRGAILAVDRASRGAPAYYMINCAHPTHFMTILDSSEPWVKRIRGLRANASKCSHAELDVATDLDDGNPVELGGEYRAILARHPHINVLGGCCGTDHRHVEAIAHACAHGVHDAQAA
jgi:S-methylmethionine-dependent homocysteine/selenocysteine methylase